MTDEQITILARRWVVLQREARVLKAVLLTNRVRIEEREGDVVARQEGREIPYFISEPLDDA